MKHLHAHVTVDDFSASKRSYSALFAAEPTVLKSDYAKWIVDDPRVNFTISHRGAQPGIGHLGIHVETGAELSEVCERLQRADRPVFKEPATTCCYAQSEKAWVSDPQGMAWEAFLTRGESESFGPDAEHASLTGAACCTPTLPQGKCCASKPDLAADAPCCGTSSPSP
jgi:hypothetical protein